MNNNSTLVRDMADAFITCIRGMEEEIAKLRSEKESLELELMEIREQTDTIYDCQDRWEAGKC